MKIRLINIFVVVLILFVVMLSITIINNNKVIEEKSLIFGDDIRQRSVFFPIVVSEKEKRFKVGTGNENSDAKLLAEYFVSDFNAIYIHADVFKQFGTEYIDYRDIPGSYVFLQLKGAFSEWTDPLPNCSAIPNQYWDNWITEFAIPVIDHIGSNRIVYIDIMNEPEGSDFAPEYLGCWGNSFYDGEYYAQFANYVVDLLRGKYPHISFSAGAFIDPPNSPAFVDGFLYAIDSIDTISLHLHEYYTNKSKLLSLIAYMESKTDIPLAMSETSVICDQWSVDCDMVQVEHFNMLVELVESKRIRFFIWYTLGIRDNCWSWRNSDMILCDPLYLRPVYHAYYEYMTNLP